MSCFDLNIGQITKNSPYDPDPFNYCQKFTKQKIFFRQISNLQVNVVSDITEI